jgi:type I restriction enzyme S subunit
LLIDNNAMAAVPTSRVESRFLYHFLRTVDFYKLASATTVPALRKSELERIRIPVPSLAEQRRIAEVLDRADALRAKRRASLAQLDFLTQSFFLDLFGDPVRNDREWPTGRVSELCELVRGSSPRPQGDPRFFGGPVPRLMVADITSRRMVRHTGD